jgi:hypothetical protein
MPIRLAAPATDHDRFEHTALDKVDHRLAIHVRGDAVVVPQFCLGGHPERTGRPLHKLAGALVSRDLPAENLGRDHAFGQVVQPFEATACTRGQLA